MATSESQLLASLNARISAYLVQDKEPPAELVNYRSDLRDGGSSGGGSVTLNPGDVTTGIDESSILIDILEAFSLLSTVAKQDLMLTALGSLATSAKQDSILSDLATVISNLTGLATSAKQDTLVTALGPLATAVKQDASNTLLTAISTALGLTSTAAKQDTLISGLDAIFTALGSLATEANQDTLQTAVNLLATSAKQDTLQTAVNLLATTAKQDLILNALAPLATSAKQDSLLTAIGSLATAAKQDAAKTVLDNILSAVATPIRVGTELASTSSTGSSYVPLVAAACKSVEIFNFSGVQIEVKVTGETAPLPLPTNNSLIVAGLTDRNQVSFRRLDQLNTAVSLTYTALR